MANNIFIDFAIVDDDLAIDPNTGDFYFEASDEQHIGDIVRSYPGEYKQYPDVGVGVGDYLNSSGKQAELQRKITVQLEADGFVVNRAKVVITPDSFTINPNAYRQ